MANDPRTGSRLTVFALAAWLLACPVLLVVAVLVLPRFDLYGTSAERFALLALMATPLIGAFAIMRRRQSPWSARTLLAAGYLVAAGVMATFAVVFLGCTWAGACF